jgi:RNA polymerase sigma-70 factor (ECF subfamily)
MPQQPQPEDRPSAGLRAAAPSARAALTAQGHGLPACREKQSAAGPIRDVMHFRTHISHVRRIAWRANRAKELDHPPRLTGGASRSDDLDSALRAALNGDEDAFRTLYRQIQPRLLRYVGTLVGDEAEDVTAEAWSHVARDIASFDGDVDGFRGWTAAIARDRALDRLHDREGRAVEKAPDGDFLELPAGDGTGKTASESPSTRAALALIASLPTDQAEIIVLHIVVGLDTETVAKVLGRRPGAVRVAAHRGLRRLEQILNGLEPPR